MYQGQVKNLFSGIRVIEFASYIAGPHAGTYLAHFGADVIKIERPRKGDESRGWPPLLEDTGVHGLYLNVGKRSVSIDLSHPEGVAVCKDLIKDADVLIESFRPGYMKKIGLDYEQTAKHNPSIIYCSVSSYGQTGPNASRPGFDAIAMASSGLMDLTGEPDGPPMRTTYMLSDYTTSYFGFGAISAALFHRERTGSGTHIDLSMQDCLVSMNSALDNYLFDGVEYTRTGQHSPRVAPFGVFKHPKGYVVLCCGNDNLWEKLVDLMGREALREDIRMKNYVTRAQNISYTKKVVEDFLATFSSIDAAVDAIDHAGIPICKVNNVADVSHDKHLLSREMIRTYQLSEKFSAPTFRGRGNPMKFSAVRMEENLSCCKVGEHTYAVLQEKGYSDEKIDGLIANGAISQAL